MMRIFGWVMAVLMLLGMFDMIDVQVCIAEKGKCITRK